MTTFGIPVAPGVRVSNAVLDIIELADDARISVKDATSEYFRYCEDPLTDSEQREVTERLAVGHSALKRADGACMCDQCRIIRADLDLPIIAIHEAPCCVPNAHGACSSTCPRAAALRKGRTT